jgi:O-antigen ligase
MTTAHITPGWQIAECRTVAQTSWAYSLLRAMVLCLLLSIIFLPEFSHEGSETSLAIYTKAAGGFRYIDLLILLAAACHVVALGCLRGKRIRFPVRLAVPGAIFLGCIVVAIVYGANHGGSKFFFDWRGLALGIVLYFAWTFWIQNEFDAAAAVRVLAAYVALRIAVLYALYLAGHRDSLAGVSIPIFDGPVLSCIVFAGLLAFSFQDCARDWLVKLGWVTLSLAAYLFVLLCFRRTYWGELAVGSMILLWRKQRHRLRSAILVAIAVGIAAAVLGGSFSNRVRSLDVTQDDNQFSADNADHVNDLTDAWYQVRQSPIMGIGVGTSYSTWHIRNWKSESVMVHNAVLHVWLKYGIAGLISYLWFHIALLLWLYRASQSARSENRAFLAAAFAYVAAQFAMTLGFAPWPYSELQLTTLLSFLVVTAVASENHLGCRIRQ